jgi:hypothetical protein
MTSFLAHRPRLRARLGLAGRLATLLGTSYFLIATSQTDPDVPPTRTDPPSQCTHGDIRFSYLVTGSCGPAGQINLISPANECAVSLQGATALGLPSAGRFDSSGVNHPDPSKGGWSLAGYLPEGAATALPSADAGPFTVNVEGTPPSGQPVAHNALVVRKCQARTSANQLLLECKDAPQSCAGSSNCGSGINACTATLQAQ